MLFGRTLILCGFTGLSLFESIDSAQDYLHQVVVFSEGWSNWQTGEVMEPATLGDYTIPSLQTFVVQDTLEDAGFRLGCRDPRIEYLRGRGQCQVLRYDLNYT